MLIIQAGAAPVKLRRSIGDPFAPVLQDGIGIQVFLVLVFNIAKFAGYEILRNGKCVAVVHKKVGTKPHRIKIAGTLIGGELVKVIRDGAPFFILPQRLPFGDTARLVVTGAGKKVELALA